jgi:hypothetical protein
MNKASREDKVQFGDVLKGTEMDRKFESYTLGTTRQAKIIDTRRVVLVGLLVEDAVHTERTGDKFGNTTIEQGTHQVILYPAGRTWQASNSNRRERED